MKILDCKDGLICMGWDNIFMLTFRNKEDNITTIVQKQMKTK